MEFRDSQAIYLQIADLVCENILLGKWKANDKILSIRDLAVELEVNPNTVMRSYEHLQGKGIIFQKRGIGYFASEDSTEKIVAVRRDEFLANELPVLFRNLYLLKIDIPELAKRFEVFKQHNFEELTH
ncbi:DNA-binding transcriptional regulator YhcF, GntR family [Pseudarcicella hirudinis]|uniref:DNA-binding transcriptional regulator YhcF, GntR family n=1 Tax=Pseudarcicella hirudinis TaxID=1079859 RepID=A0A1I5NT21_9BACT|nr:GntR family transcriptional regulator [Pseudarcicella hirudinis]SFP24837.1 DNA-binding transcriptional regulator YhcF, GntR family [Pseudarcicella hirudinis]